MTGGEEGLINRSDHGWNPKCRQILRPIGPASEYILMQDDVGLWPTAALDCSEKWLARKGTRLVGMPHEVRGLPWLLVHSLKPGQWHHRETGREAGDEDFDAGCWALMEGTALGLPGDLLRRVDADLEESLQAPELCRSPARSPARCRPFVRQTSQAGSDPGSLPTVQAGATKPLIPQAKAKLSASDEDEAGEISTASTSATNSVSPGSSLHDEGSPRERFDSGKMCIGGDIQVNVHGRSGTQQQPLREALKTVIPRLQAMWCTLTNDQETRLGAYKGHFNAIVFFLLGVQRAHFMKGARKHVQMMFDALARPKTGALEEMLTFSKCDNKDQGLALFRESMNDCIQELLACLVNLTAFVDESARACALAALADVEASAAAVTYGLPKVPEEDQRRVNLSRIGSTNTRSITVSRETDAGTLRQMLVECLGFPSSIRLLGPKDSHKNSGTLHPLPPAEMLVEGGAITVHGAITLHPGPSETVPRERTQAEFEWAFHGNVPRVTILQAIEMFQELRDGFAEEDFQDKLENLHKAFSESKDTVASQKAMHGITELAYAVQSKVIAKYGYPSTPEGVKMMRSETADMYCRDERLHDLSRECQDLLSMKIAPTAADKIVKPPPPITLLKSSRFALQDVPHWKEHLNTHGYVVIADIISEEQRLKALDLLWDFLEASDGNGTVDRDEHKTWQDSRAFGCGWPARKEDGIINGRGIGQSSCLWYLRGLPQLKEVFAALWGTSSLVTSFDGASVFRPHGLDASWRPKRQHWYHVDQAHSKRGLHCVQGLVTLTPSTEERGGLVVVPGSHRFHNEVLRKYKATKGNYVQLKATDAIVREGGGPRLVGAEAGDLVLWDSRTVHCNSAPLKEDKCQSLPELLRAAAYVCMTPGRWCSKATLENRSNAVEHGITCTHWPHELFSSDLPKDRGVCKENLNMPEVELSAQQKELVRPSEAVSNPSVKIGGGERVIASGTPSFLPMSRFRVMQDKAQLLQAPYEQSTPTPIGSIARGQVVSGHVFGDWLRLDPISIWEVLRSGSSPQAAAVAAHQNEQEAWLKIAGGMAVRD